MRVSVTAVKESQRMRQEKARRVIERTITRKVELIILKFNFLKEVVNKLFANISTIIKVLWILFPFTRGVKLLENKANLSNLVS